MKQKATKTFALLLGMALLSLLNAPAYSQAEATGTIGYLSINGRLFDLSQYADVVEGTPFLYKDWQKAMVQMPNDGVINNTDIKLNLLDNELYFKDPAGKEMIATDHIKAVTFNQGSALAITFITKYALGNAAAGFPNGWYQLLQKGNAMLLKEHHKAMTTSKGYGTGPGEKVIETEYRYYVWYNGSFTRVKKLDEVAAALGSAKLSQWMAGKKAASKAEKDMVDCVAFFNGQ